MIAVNNDDFEEGSTEMSDAMLVSTAKSGDGDAFVELSKRHYRKVFHETYRITRNRQDAEDALQESLLRAFCHLNNFEGRSSFSTWLTRIAINSALMILRKRRNCFDFSLDDTDDPERQMGALGDTIPRGGPREQLRSQRERSVAKGSNTPAAATLPGSRRTLASKGIFHARDRTSSRNFCSRSQVKSIARKIDAACRIASSRFAIQILLILRAEESV